MINAIAYSISFSGLQPLAAFHKGPSGEEESDRENYKSKIRHFLTQA
jgi:hypothetical protein